MKLKKIEIALLLGVCMAVLVGFSCIREQQTLASKMIRLHVIANSDSDIDQSLKLLVRDSIILEVNQLLDEGKDISQAIEVINKNLSDLEKNAEAVLRDNGCSYEVHAELGREEYTTRLYDHFTLPAGEYHSLRVQIGEASGQNWWCVVFPPLCFAAASDFEVTAEAAGLSDEEIKLITENDREVVFKFQVLEVIQKIMSYFKQKI